SSCLSTNSTSVRWTTEMVRGKEFRSTEDTGVLWMGFPERGNHVAVTVGDRNGWVAGPVYKWSVEKNGKLVFTEDGEMQDVFELIRFSNDKVEVVHNDQRKVVYDRVESKTATSLRA
ncbi:MAG: hypothetical protein KDM64_05760, partial [Verrucomicrobiae bacterium]|nr:hypothetical protein [Verrucomicrobiae bacterium]